MLKFVLSENCEHIVLEEAESTEQINQLHLYFRRRIENFKFDPRVKRGLWDGYFDFFDKFNRLESGLYGELNKFSKEHNIKIHIEGLERIFDLEIEFEHFNNFITEYFREHKIQPHDYQIKAAFNIIKYRRSLSEIATSGGKTLILFMCFMYLKRFRNIKRMLIIVPTIDLIGQGAENFEEYSEHSDFSFNLLKIGGGEKKIKENVDIVIGTYQTLVNLDKDFYLDFDVVAVDEAHQAPVSSIVKVLNYCKNAKYRFGVSGTLKLNEWARSFSIQQKLGPPVNSISAKFLFDNEFATKVRIKVLILDYADEALKKSLYNIRKDRMIEGTKKIQVEKKIILADKKRLNFIVNLINKLDKNTLVLFNDIQGGYGKTILNELKLNSEKIPYYIDGGTDKKFRNFYKNDMESGDNKVLIASFGTFKQGISINNLHNILFVESYKSEIVVKQSIGRGMRLLENKDHVNIYDIVDDFIYDKNFNYVMMHMKERINVYKRDSYPYEIKKIKL